MSQMVEAFDPLHNVLVAYTPAPFQLHANIVLIIAIAAWSGYLSYFTLLRSLYRRIASADEKWKMVTKLIPFFIFTLWAGVFVVIFAAYPFINQKIAYNLCISWTYVAGYIETWINSIKVAHHMRSSRYFRVFEILQYANYIGCIITQTLVALAYFLPDPDPRLVLAKIILHGILIILHVASHVFVYLQTGELVQGGLQAKTERVVYRIHESSRYGIIATMAVPPVLCFADFTWVAIFMFAGSFIAVEYTALFTDGNKSPESSVRASSVSKQRTLSLPFTSKT